MPFTPAALKLQCDGTLDALEKTYDVLDNLQENSKRPASIFASERQRIEDIKELKRLIDSISTETDEETRRVRKPKRPEKGAEKLDSRLSVLRDGPDVGLPAWESDQVELAMGRLYAEARAWDRTLTIFTELFTRLTARKKVDRLVEFGVYAHRARALRESARGKPRETERYMEALQTAAEGVRRDPLNVEARREAGRAHFALAQFSDALASWEHALWLSPSDPYLHYEVAMCFRRLAQGQPEQVERRRLVECAKWHFDRARELFDGEDLDGEAWTRLWRGKIALEAGEPAEALEYLQGAEHGNAEAAAALLVGEAHLALDQRPAAGHAFDRCTNSMEQMRKDPELRAQPTIDWLWGDELPWKAVEVRIKRGKAEAIHLAPGDWQSKPKAEKAKQLLGEAREILKDIKDDDARDAATTRVLDTRSLLRQVSGRVDQALELVHERLRYEKTPEALRLQGELLDLRARWGKRLPDAVLAEIAAERIWKELPGDGRPTLARPTLRKRLRAVIGNGVEKK